MFALHFGTIYFCEFFVLVENIKNDKWMRSWTTKSVTTLVLGSQPMQGAWKGEGQECNLGVTFTLSKMRGSVKEWTHTFLNGLPLWSWKPRGLLNIQKVIWGVKTYWIEKFHIPLKISWNVNVINELTWSIWILIAQIMAKRRVKNQSVNLTFDH
jgi:hypothetical protein